MNKKRFLIRLIESYAKKNLKDSELYINRELSWIEFNDRVLQLGVSKDMPLAERLKFLSIVSSNLDEFFMIRVAGLMQQKAAKVTKRDLSGMTATQQLALVSKRVHEMVAQQDAAINDLFNELADVGLYIIRAERWSGKQRDFLKKYFNKEIMPVLTPLAIQDFDQPPILPGRQINVAVTTIKADKDETKKRILVVPVPNLFPRFITIPSRKDITLALLEDVIADNLNILCRNEHINSVDFFRVTRDADVSIQEDEAADLLGMIEEAVLSRRRRAAVRLEISGGPSPFIKSWLESRLNLNRQDIYEINSILDATALNQLTQSSALEKNRVEDWPPQWPLDLMNSEDIWQTLKEKDVLLFHPYESFEPVIQLMQQAADDPNVLAIKQTLYRTSGQSPIIDALERAARSGKEVTVLVELKARFDESRNINWARRLEDAGCHVIYGIARLKTHAKSLLIIRREASRIRRYVHLSTGNYNDKTTKLYSDIGLMTCDKGIATDVASFFNLLTGYSETAGWQDLTIAPTDMKRKFISLIEREIQTSTRDHPGLIMAKFNSLQDRNICQALYRANQSGVKIMLNVRGICCLRPSINGISENIEVRSIVDRFLEHARIFYFRNAGHDEIYLSSADWMQRNLDRRLEILFPVKDPKTKKRLIRILKTYFNDNSRAQNLMPDGTYKAVPKKGGILSAQEHFYKDLVEAVKNVEHTNLRFRPMTRPDK